MLLPVTQGNSLITWRATLWLAVAGCLACCVAGLQEGRAWARQDKQADAKKAGRIFVNAILRTKVDNEEKTLRAIIAIDPKTGAWKMVTDKENARAARVSPDGETLAFTVAGETWDCDTGGGNAPGQIIDKGGWPIWSPDSKQLITTKQTLVSKKEGWKSETWRQNANGSKPIRLPIPATDVVRDWSADGKWLVTRSSRDSPDGKGSRLYLMTADGENQTALTKEGYSSQPRFAPDSRRVAYIRHNKGENSLWVMDIDGKNPRRVFEDASIGIMNVCWSPDGKRFALQLIDWSAKGPGYGNFDTANWRIEIMDVDGQNRHELKPAKAAVVFVGDLDWR